MAKKGQAVQLQQEINCDEDWEKMLQKDGLIVVDIYSDWCGPCSAMIANLKKLKLEIGGDNLHLATANSDKISYLKRFRGKSEPTWMFIAGKKMVNLLFGANAPKLVRTIIQELENEAEVKAGNRERIAREISELSDEEQVRYDAAKRIKEEAIQIETERKELLIRNKRLALANHVLKHFPNVGLVLVFPHATKQAQYVLAESWSPVGLTVSNTEKVLQLTEETLEEILYFADSKFSKGDIYHLTNAASLVYLIKPTNSDDYTNDIDEAILEVVYGSSKCPPGDPGSPADSLIMRISMAELQSKLSANTRSLQSKLAKAKAGEEIHQTQEENILDLAGLWAPPNALTRATAIKCLLPKMYDPIALPQPSVVPPHVAVIFEAFKRKEVLDLIKEYRSEVIRYGFFSDDNPTIAKLIAKTLPLFEKAIQTNGTTYGEKLVVQLAKTNPVILDAFCELGPTFVSKNSVKGEEECKLFFPDDYDVPEGDRNVVETKKKKKKGKKTKEPIVTQQVLAEGEQMPIDETIAAEHEAEGELIEGDGEGESDGEGEESGEKDGQSAEDGALEEEAAEGADKATSPMPEDGSIS